MAGFKRTFGGNHQIIIVILCFFHVVFYQVFLWNTYDIYEIYELWAGFLHGFPSTNSFFFFIRNRKFKRMISHVFSGSRIFEPTPTPMFWKKNLVKIDPKQTPCICRSPRVCVNLFLAAKDSRSFESVKVLGIICPSTEESHSPTVIETYWTNKWCDCMRVSWSR